MIIGLAGRKGVGKDTTADYIVSKYDYTKLAFADPLKQICRILFLLADDQLCDPIKKETIDERWGMRPRQMFQMVGTDLCRRHIRDDIWIHHMKLRILPNKNYIISDVRFQNEKSWIEDQGGMVLFINRVNENHDEHESEKLEFYDPNKDVLISNNGSIQELYNHIDDILKLIMD